MKKIWHTWTLDPLATGGLLIAVWNYTKLIPYFEKDSKTYEFEVSFDGETDSFDLWTEVRFLDDKRKKYFQENLTKGKLEDILKENFLWEITQIPPKYSALKINWKKALDKVRAGEDFDLVARKCTIFEIKLLNFSYPKAKILAKVSAGTYIRSIANDLWKIIWCWAYVTELRRTFIWDLDIKFSQDLENFEEEKKLDLKEIFKNKNFETLNENILKKINNWLPVFWEFPFEKDSEIFAFDGENVTNIIFYDGEKLLPKRKII